MIHFANVKLFCKVGIFSGIIFLISFTSNAQLLIGPKIGGQISWISLEDKSLKEDFDILPLPGYHGGFSIAFQVQKRFYLETSFLYSRKGKKIEGKIDPLLNYKSVNHHFDMPIIYRMDFKAQLGKSKAFKWYFGVGPNISYWWKGSGELETTELVEMGISPRDFDVDFNGDTNDEDESKLIITEPNRIQLGINFASGLVLEPPGGNFIVVEFRFELGHSYQSKEEFGRFPGLVEFADPARSRNMGLRLSVSYLFDTKISERKKGKSTIKN